MFGNIHHVHPNKSTVIISNGDMKTIKMFVGKEETKRSYADYTGNNENKIIIDEEGCGDFIVAAGSISVWIEDGIEF